MATTQQTRHRSHEAERAQELLRQPVVDGQEVLALIKPLKAERAFGIARKLLDHALHHPARPITVRFSAVSTKNIISTSIQTGVTESRWIYG